MASFSYQNHNKGISRTVIVLAVTLIFFIILPIGFILFLFAGCFRTILKFYVKHFRPEYGKIMPLRNTLFNTEIPGKTSRNSMFHGIILKGSIDMAKLKSDILKKVFEKNAEGNLKYPELQQSVTLFFGYMFWKWDKDFNIDNHVFEGYKGSTSLDVDGMNRMIANEVQNPHLRSPWEVYMFPEYKDRSGDGEPRSAILIRFNHVLLDGFAQVYIMAGAAGIKLPEQRSKNTQRNVLERIFNRIMNLLLAPYQIFGFVYDTWDGSCLRVDNKVSIVTRFSDPIPMLRIKDLKNKFGVSFNSILAAAYTGGLRKLMLENCIEIPRVLHAYTPMPMLGHADKLRNNLKMAYVTLPVGLLDPIERLNFVEASLKELPESRLPSQLYYALGILGVFPAFVVRLEFRLNAVSGGITNFPYSLKGLSYNGHSVEHMLGAHGMFPSNAGATMTTASFNDFVIVNTNFVKSSLLNGNEEVLLNSFLEELKILEGLAKVTCKPAVIVEISQSSK